MSRSFKLLNGGLLFINSTIISYEKNDINTKPPTTRIYMRSKIQRFEFSDYGMVFWIGKTQHDYIKMTSDEQVQIIEFLKLQ